MTPLLVAAATSGSPVRALNAVLKVEPDALSAEWHAALRETYRSGADRPAPGRMRPLLEASKPARLNVGPAISPDGRLVAFYSERGGVAVDLFVADAGTGAIRRQLTELAIDPHTDSLQFVNAAGAWSADSRRLAFAGIGRGRPELAIAEVETGRVERRIPLPGLGDVFSASWSPDDRSIVVSAMAGGHLDLFLVDTGTDAVARLTDDAYAELQPAWSPDGRTIVYATDRFSTDLAGLAFGDLRLALMDPATREIRPLPAFETGKHLSPHWSDAGRAVVFVSDQDGVPDVYRLGLSDGRIERLTSVQTGVSGIARSSPALSVADTGRMVVTVHQAGGYQLYVDDQPVEAAPTSVATDQVAAGGERVVSASGPTPDPSTFQVREYRPRLGLESIAPLQAGVGIGDLGPLVSGGTAATFSDLLGHHRVTVGLQGSSFVQGGLDSLSVVGGYQNERGRWSWGINGGQFSYPATTRASGIGLFGDEPRGSSRRSGRARSAARSTACSSVRSPAPAASSWPRATSTCRSPPSRGSRPPGSSPARRSRTSGRSSPRRGAFTSPRRTRRSCTTHRSSAARVPSWGSGTGCRLVWRRVAPATSRCSQTTGATSRSVGL